MDPRLFLLAVVVWIPWRAEFMRLSDAAGWQWRPDWYGREGWDEFMEGLAPEEAFSKIDGGIWLA